MRFKTLEDVLKDYYHYESMLPQPSRNIKRLMLKIEKVDSPFHIQELFRQSICD